MSLGSSESIRYKTLEVLGHINTTLNELYRTANRFKVAGYVKQNEKNITEIVLAKLTKITGAEGSVLYAAMAKRISIPGSIQQLTIQEFEVLLNSIIDQNNERKVDEQDMLVLLEKIEKASNKWFKALENMSTSSGISSKIKKLKSNTSCLLKTLKVYLNQFFRIVFGYSNKKANDKAKELTKSLSKYYESSDIRTIFLNLHSSSIKSITLNSNEIKILNFLHQKVDWQKLPKGISKELVMLELLYGAYFVIEDGGKNYDQWKKGPDSLLGIKRRLSSHCSDNSQYAFRGSFFKEFLFSTKSDENGKRVTWFQLERYPATFLMNIHHLVTYILYKFTGKNQGPFGASIYRENFNEFVLYLKE
jgi:hypothetical protein